MLIAYLQGPLTRSENITENAVPEQKILLITLQYRINRPGVVEK